MRDEGRFGGFWSLRYAAAGGPLTQRMSQYLGAMIAYAAQRLRLTPNVLTLTGLMLSVLGSVVFASSTGFFASLCSLLLYQLSYGFDCADGQLARATNKGSEYGAWLDVNCDAAGALVMGFTLLYYFDAGSMSVIYSFFAAGLFTLGRVIHIYSVPAIKGRVSKTDSRFSGSRKTILWLLMDTPFFYVVVCALRGLPALLLSYLCIMGVVYGAAAMNNVRRLAGTQSVGRSSESGTGP